MPSTTPLMPSLPSVATPAGAAIYIREAQKRIMVDNAFARLDEHRARKSVSLPGTKTDNETKRKKTIENPNRK